MFARIIAAVMKREKAMSLKGKLVRFFLMLGISLLLPITVDARLITENPSIPGFPSDPAFAGSLVIALDQTLPAKCGDQSFTMTVGGVQFLFRSSTDLFNGVYSSCFPLGAPLGQGTALSSNGRVVININPAVSAFGIIAAGAECLNQATFTGSLGTELGTGASFDPATPTFLGAADIGGISTVALSDTCTSGSGRWTQIRFVPAGGVPPAQADVALNKTPSASAIGGVAPLGYSLGVANFGPDTAKDVVAADLLPPGVTVDGTSAGATLSPPPPLPASTVTWALGDLARGGTDRLALMLAAPPFETFSCEDTLLNIAAVGTSTTDPNLRNNVAFTVTPFDKASRANVPEICDNFQDDNCNGMVDCNDPACTTVCNPAFAPAPGVGPGGGGGNGGDPGSCMNLHGESFPAPCCDPFNVGAQLDPLCRAFDPNFKESDPSTNAFGYGYAQAGQAITYTIHYENIGTADAHDVSILDPLHPSLDETTLAINNGGVYDPGPRVIVWHDPLALPPQVPRSVSFSVNINSNAQPGTRVRNRGTVVFPDAATSPRTDTNFVEHTVLDPQFPVVADLVVRGCQETSPRSHQWKVKLVNKGFGFAYNVSAEIVSPPAFVQVSDALASFAHPADPHPDVLATVMPLSTSLSVDTVSFITTTREDPDRDQDRKGEDVRGDPCGVFTWRIRYTTSNGETLSKDIHPSLAQLCPCAGPAAGGTWKNHGAYESCMTHAAQEFVQAGFIAERQKDAIVSAAAHSVCGGKAETEERERAESEN